MNRNIVTAVAVAAALAGLTGCTTTGATAGAASTDSKAKTTKVDPYAAAFWHDKDWVIYNKPTVREDALDMFDINGVVTYVGKDTKGGDTCIDISLDKGTSQVTSGTSCVSSVHPGNTAKLNFSTFDSYVAGPYKLRLTKSFG
jgi:hypothetical protein